MIAAVPAGHTLAEAATIGLEDLAAEPFIMYAPYEARYFHDLLVELFSRAALAPVYVQHLAPDPFDPGHRAFRRRRRAGAGSGAESAVQRRRAAAAGRSQQRPAELFFVWRDDNDNPLLPVIAAIARDLAGGA